MIRNKEGIFHIIGTSNLRQMSALESFNFHVLKDLIKNIVSFPRI